MVREQLNPTPSDELTLHQLELIAELVEGSLGDTDREEALRLLKDSPVAYEVYVETIVALRGVGQPVDSEIIGGVGEARLQEAPARAEPSRKARAADHMGAASRNHQMRRVMPLAAAAGIAALALGIGLFTGLRGGPPAAALRAQAFSAPALAAAITAEHPLTTARGPATAGSDAGRAFRLGVRVMDVEGAIRAGESSATRIAEAQAVSLLQSMDAPSTVMISFQGVFSELSESDRVEVERGLESWLSGQPPRLERYRLGRSAEALRFAIVAGDPQLVRSSSRYLNPAVLVDISPDAVDSAAVLVELAQDAQFAAMEQSGVNRLLGEGSRVERLLGDLFRTASR
jgi:hypothetical protein